MSQVNPYHIMFTKTYVGSYTYIKSVFELEILKKMSRTKFHFLTFQDNPLA